MIAKPLKLSLLAAAMLTLVSCGATSNSSVLEVRVANPVVQTLSRTVELSGVLTPEKTAAIYGKLSGQASKILVDVGSRVKENDILLEIDAHELGAQLALAEASVATVKQQAGQARVGVDTAQTNYDQAKRYLDRLNALEDRAALSKNQLDDATSKVELTQRALESAKLQYKTTSESGLAQAMAQADVVKSQIANSILRSPIDGVVTNRNINPGELTNPAVALFSVAKIDRLKLQGTVGQDVVSLLSEGRDVSVLVDGMAGDPFQGKVTQIGPVAATSGQYFPVVVTIDRPGKALAGMTARVALDVASGKAPTVPVTALKTDQGRAWVFVVESGKVRQVSVSLGLSDGHQVQVLRGLKADQQVATSNVSLLSDGTEVLAKP
jgi:RND family efflux transporter MFP subunit